MVPYDPGGIGVQRAYGGFIPSLIGLIGTMQALALSERALFSFYLSLPSKLQRFCLCDSFFSLQPDSAVVRLIYSLGLSLRGKQQNNDEAGGSREAWAPDLDGSSPCALHIRFIGHDYRPGTE
jgi:hypothetical protein